jgi:hypothetical protein
VTAADRGVLNTLALAYESALEDSMIRNAEANRAAESATDAGMAMFVAHTRLKRAIAHAHGLPIELPNEALSMLLAEHPLRANETGPRRAHTRAIVR